VKELLRDSAARECSGGTVWSGEDSRAVRRRQPTPGRDRRLTTGCARPAAIPVTTTLSASKWDCSPLARRTGTRVP